MGLERKKIDSGRKRVGSIGEDIACLFLKRKGFSILERNYRKPWGEIDILAEKGGIVRIVEVKAISTPNFSREMDYRPEELVDERKLGKLARTAALFMESRKDEREYQIDVVGIILNESSRTAKCRLFEQVLGGDL